MFAADNYADLSRFLLQALPDMGAKRPRTLLGQVLLAAPNNIPNRNLTLATAPHEDLDPICAIQSFYLLVEAVARARGHDPDKPRHLSKVTRTL